MSVPLEYLRDRTWRRGIAALLAATIFAFHAPLIDMVQQWWSKADYSHGFLVLPFALYVLWTRKELMPRFADWPDWSGLAFIAAGVALSLVAGLTNYAKELGQGLGFILALTGVV